MIYVISQGDSAVVKIGHGGNPKKRLTELQTGSPIQLLLQWTHDGGEELEGHLHVVFAEYRIRGEWFDLTPLGDAVAAIREAVEAATGSEMLRAPRFRVPGVVHPAEPVASAVVALDVVRDPTWDERFPLPRPKIVRRMAAGEDVRPGCIRQWQGKCRRPSGASCGC